MDHPHTSVDWGRATTTIRATTDEIFSVITDYERYRQFLPQVTSSRVLSRNGMNATVYIQTEMVGGSLTMWAQLNIYARPPKGSTRIVEAQMVDGNMDRFKARWEITPSEDGQATQVSLQLIAEPEVPVPSFLVSRHNEGAARWAVQSLRRRVLQADI
ncbi:MAG: SRPBCC family protein [Myxococcota bacterium]